MSQNVGSKSIIALFAAVGGYLYNSLTEMIAVLTILMILDYVVGILAAIKQGQKFDKEKALWGAAKKALYGAVLIVAYLGDYIIIYLTQNAGISLPIKGFLGIAVTLYLIGTEGFSNVQSFIVLGLPAPVFLLKFFGLIRDHAGKIIEMPPDPLEAKGSVSK
jgi:phage-related holin